LRHINDEIAAREVAFRRYDQRLNGTKGLTIPPLVSGLKQNFAYYPILVEPEAFGIDRDQLAQKLSENGIFARKYFYPLVSENKAFGKSLTEQTQKALKFSRNVLCLPMFAHLSMADVDRICDLILE
jgi:dTDP-4-amino-4,6-dideoxygalactose transaminase